MSAPWPVVLPWPPGSYAEAHAEEQAKIEAAHAEERAKFEAELKATENGPVATMTVDDFWNSLDREDLACLGLERVRHPFKDDFFSDLKKQAQEEYFASLPKPREPPEPPKPPKPPTLASVAKDARKAGIDPARIEIRPDGSYVVDIGGPEQQQGNEVDEWIAKHAHETEGNS